MKKKQHNKDNKKSWTFTKEKLLQKEKLLLFPMNRFRDRFLLQIL